MKTHIITAQWLHAKTEYGNPRVMIKRKYVFAWDKEENKLEKYKFLGYSQSSYTFKIECLGKKCGWSHLI